VPRLVVLPFQNIGTQDDQYFADGITEEITARLAVVQGIAVISRTSAIQYRNTGKKLKQIGRELGVQYVLEGTIRWQHTAGGQDRVRVTPQLIRVADDEHLWASIYDEQMAEVFAVQSNVAEQVVAALGVALQRTEREALAAKPTKNLDAYTYYLRGREYARQGQLKAENLKAVEMFERAVALDPSFAEAWTWLATTNGRLYWYNFDPTERRRALTKAAAERAFALDTTWGHLALGSYYYFGRVDWDRALEHLSAAEKTHRVDSAVLATIGFVYRRRGEWQRAVQYLERALETDPRNASVLSQLSSTHERLRQYDQAARYSDRAIALAPDQVTAYLNRAWVYLAWKGDRAAAIAVLRRGAERVGGDRLFADAGAGRGTLSPWVLGTDPDYRLMLERLTPGAGGRDPAWYYLDKAVLFQRLGAHARARIYADSARATLEPAVRAAPDSTTDAVFRSSLGLAYAILGRREAAVDAGRKAVALAPVTRDAFLGPQLLINLGLIYLAVGDRDAAVQQFQTALAVPSQLSPALLKLVLK
jgi:serine/threonine-protein kinase